MSEAHLFWAVPMAGLVLTLFTTLYRLGGWKQKAWRRFAGGAVLALGIQGVALYCRSWGPWMLFSLVTIPGWLSMGYGGETTRSKLTRRALYGLIGGLAVSFPFCVGSGGLLVILGLQTALAVAASIVYGLRNPISAVGEEGTLGAAYAVLVVFSVIR